jgi:hypothetical protein
MYLPSVFGYFSCHNPFNMSLTNTIRVIFGHFWPLFGSKLVIFGFLDRLYSGQQADSGLGRLLKPQQAWAAWAGG